MSKEVYSSKIYMFKEVFSSKIYMSKEGYNKKYDRVSKKIPKANAFLHFKVDLLMKINAHFYNYIRIFVHICTLIIKS